VRLQDSPLMPLRSAANPHTPSGEPTSWCSPPCIDPQSCPRQRFIYVYSALCKDSMQHPSGVELHSNPFQKTDSHVQASPECLLQCQQLFPHLQNVCLADGSGLILPFDSFRGLKGEEAIEGSSYAGGRTRRRHLLDPPHLCRSRDNHNLVCNSNLRR
jgi:hypothetical protein